MVEDLIKRLRERAPNAETGDDSCLMELASDAIEQQAARLTALESERDALLAAAGKEAVKGEPLAWLIDWPDEPDLGHYFGEEPNEFARSVPLYTAPTADLEKGDGRDAARWRACVARKCFPEYCGHDDAARNGASWYMPSEWAPEPFATPEEAIDAALSQKAGEQQ